jgi:hypothetical protein
VYSVLNAIQSKHFQEEGLPILQVFLESIQCDESSVDIFLKLKQLIGINF